MKRSSKIILLIVCLGTSAFAQNKPVIAEPGVSLQLATYRHKAISKIQYALDFDIPAGKSSPIHASESISFDLAAVQQPLQLDFKQPTDHVMAISVNGKKVAVNLKDEHLIIDAANLTKGSNKIELQFIAGDQSLNRNDDYLYALFVPDRARTVFPCFDQPNLKANFLLTMHVPADWKVLANAVQKEHTLQGNRSTYQFANSDKLSTYLFSFTAGKYSEVTQTPGNRKQTFLYRETDSNKIRLSVDSVFTGHKNAISFLESWTGIPFPFQKVGYVAIPDFQFGGMEHPGEVQYKASSLFLDEGATKDQFISRANLISHETAHMWFGDMVTMEWFNDVWMKEVFANFMADKVTEKMMGSETFNLKFLQDHYPAAYAVDRTEGANPIRQQLDNLQDAGSLYGNIIYHKAPIMMRQLEQLMGKENFRLGIQEYLKKYAYTNATWNDLIGILSKHTKADLYKWNAIWVNQPGRPVFDYNITYAGNKISNLNIVQHAETGKQRIWPQVFDVTLVYPSSSKSVPVNMDQPQIALKEVAGLPKPSYILFNSNGMGYGLFPSDKAMGEDEVYNLQSPLQRASVYITAYENMLAGRYFKPAQLLALFNNGLTVEKNEMNLRLLTGYIQNIYWEFLPSKNREAVSAMLESTILKALNAQTPANNKKILFKAYQDVYLSQQAKEMIYNIWKLQQPPAGVKLTEEDYTSLALSIALKSDTATSVLKLQEARISNADRKKRLEFLMPALSANQSERDNFFTSLAERGNRQKEAWVTTALAYLNHPLRQPASEKYLPKSLELVEEIQRTGDVFFPQSWLGAIFSNYQSKEVAQVVREFLTNHPGYNPKLKDKILQSADNLFRAQNLARE